MATKKHLFIIGAPKAATTSFARWLCLNGSIYEAALKEPGYFRDRQDSYILNARGDRTTTKINFDLDKYLALYADARDDQWVVDASTDYLSSENAPQRLKEFSQDKNVKLLCLLRDPIERAFSEYLHTLRDDLENTSFRKSLLLEEKRIAEGWQPLFFHVRRSRYFADIARYRRLFGDRLMILDHSALTEPQETAAALTQFLSVPIKAHAPPHLNQSKAFVDPMAGAIRKNPFARIIADRVIGEKQKALAKQLLERILRRSKTLSPGDRDFLFGILENDIRACLNDETIPTAGWKTVAAAAR